MVALHKLRMNIFTLLWVLVLLPAFSLLSVRDVYAQTPTPTQGVGVGTFVPLLPSPTAIDGTVGRCPELGVEGIGTITPDAVWALRCGHCLDRPVSTPSPLLPTPTPGPNNWWVHWFPVRSHTYTGMATWGTTTLQETHTMHAGAGESVGVLLRITARSGTGNMRLLETTGTVNGSQSFHTITNGATYCGHITTGNGSFGCSQPAAQPNVAYSHPLSTVHRRSGQITLNYVLQKDNNNPGTISYQYGVLMWGRPPLVNVYQVEHTMEMDGDGQVYLHCGTGDNIIGGYVMGGVQGNPGVSGEVLRVEMLDTGGGRLLMANVLCPLSTNCAVMDSQVTSGYAAGLNPWARISQVNITGTSVILRWDDMTSTSGLFTTRNTVTGRIYCQGSGQQGFVDDGQGYCNAILPSQGGIDEMPLIGYIDGDCLEIPPIVVGEISIPGMRICRRVMNLGTMNIFGLQITMSQLITVFLAYYLLKIMKRI